MTRLHKLELAYARARIARAKVRNARPYMEVDHGWEDAEMHLDRAMIAIERLIVLQKQHMKETA